VTVTVTVNGKHEEATENYDEGYDIPLDYEVTLCEFCRKNHETYHEGILQARNERPEFIAAIERYLEKRHAVVTRAVTVHDGTDYYLSDSRTVKGLAEYLHKEFGGELHIAAQHFSEDKQAGKILYRTNALLALPDYQKGDVIEKDDTYYLVLGISNKVKAEDLLQRATVSFPYIRGQAILLKPTEVKIVKTDPVEVLHPETYQPVRIENPQHLPARESLLVVFPQNHAFVTQRATRAV